MGQITCISWDKKKAKGGEFISPVLNISEEHIPICVQFYINTVIQSKMGKTFNSALH